ncbi:SDR family NAD(P)-dependent oxidoreductase [Promicromonospora iranensis]|uniref:SDR family NAD(P)-dependent oxidoreductase n=1 Tax=Promicromonospora iranensis TaxID=1105144 RepID=UPI0023A97115|nr:SDR family NAD(P)-dependent oxidoreductase [Promicromonospora iranensis]
MPKTWFITGTSTGLGREWTEAALERGDHVAATARDTSTLEPLVSKYGEAVLPISLDVTDRSAVLDAVGRAVEHLGRLDVVVNNAGYGHLGMVEEVTERELRAQMETNFFGTVWVTQAVLPVLRAQGSGRILQVTSEGGVRAYPGFGAYHASKWAVEGLTESLAQEVAAFGVQVTNVEPGPYATGFATAAHTSAPHPDYADVRTATAPDFQIGDPHATRAALLRIADADRAPLHVFLGRPLADVEEIYAERLRTWREWEPVALEAFGA